MTVPHTELGRTPERWQREMRVDPPGPHKYQDVEVPWFPYHYCAVCEQTETNCAATIEEERDA